MKAPNNKKESTINIGLDTQCFLTSIPDSWEGLEAVTNVPFINDCTTLTSIPDSWEGLEAVTNASSMFYNCTSIARIPASWEGLDENGNFTGVCP
jgi:hypothetical protein